MKINGNMVMFLTELFDEYKKKLYLKMRKDAYSMDKILSFINGYSIVSNQFYEFSINKIFVSNDKFTTIFNNKDEMVNMLNNIVENVKLNYTASDDEWEKIGIKYAICFAKFYITDVLFGDDTEVEDDLYMDIPDDLNPEHYHWEDRGFDYDM